MSDCTWTESDFTAAAVYTGENRLVHVQGTGKAPSPGYEATLAIMNPGVTGKNPHPERIYAEITEVAPEGDRPRVITPISVDAIFGAREGKTVVSIHKVGLIPIIEPA